MTTAVTGWALRTPLGGSVDSVTERLLAGERAAGPNTRFPSRSYACSLAAPILEPPGTSPHARILGRLGLFALEVAREALTDAAATAGTTMGVYSAMGGLRAHWNDIMPALAQQQPDLSKTWNRGFKQLHPFWMLQHLSNNVHALVAQQLGARGDGVTFSGGNAGAQALAAAERALEAGAIDVALVVAYDSLIEPETIVEMAARHALAPGALEHLRAPYDRRANGGVPGEAAAALVLERADQAGARARCTLSATDVADGEPTEPGAETVARAAARLAHDDNIVDGCALGTPARDLEEVEALARVLSAPLRLTALQASTGLLGAATALVQAITLASLLRRGVLAPIAGLREPGHPAIVTQTEALHAPSAVGLSASAPGLVGAVRVSVEGVIGSPGAP